MTEQAVVVTKGSGAAVLAAHGSSLAHESAVPAPGLRL
jgi:hypothetical protein